MKRATRYVIGYARARECAAGALAPVFAALSFVVPFLVVAQDTGGPNRTLFGIITILEEAARALLPVAVTVATLFFFWGMIMLILQAGNEAARAKGKSIMLWGVVALFVIISIWGIVEFLGNIFGTEAGGNCPPPEIGRSTVSSCALP